jgi:hypothetical protein
MEYMLEFLSVLYGFKYHLGQGLNIETADSDYQTTYKLPKRLGLRRFVFYDGREKTLDPRDQRAVEQMKEELRALFPYGPQEAEELMNQLRALFRSFSAIEDARSWYAKSLLPVHEEFLLWEALRKGATQKTYVADVSELDKPQLDREIEFFARNFFSRGGELYYLMISAGTEGNLAQRQRITKAIETLLNVPNRTLGDFAKLINKAWTDDRIEGSLGWLPDPECALYRTFAEDLDTFLDNKLDSLECLELLAHLICFHIVCYIYHRAHPANTTSDHTNDACVQLCRPQLLIDLLGDDDGGLIRERSTRLLRQHSNWQIERAQALVREKVQCWADSESNDDALAEHLEYQSGQFFNLPRKEKASIGTFINEMRERYRATSVDREEIVREFSTKLFDLMSRDFRTHFLSVHTKLGRAIGLISPRRGPNPRFTLGDTLLKTLVTANLPPEKTMSFGDLLERLYERYGIIVGPYEANRAGLLERLRINESYYAHNRDALLVRMKCAGLVTQYSDATALVKRH